MSDYQSLHTKESFFVVARMPAQMHEAATVYLC
jgi:hypothetical protein